MGSQAHPGISHHAEPITIRPANVIPLHPLKSRDAAIADVAFELQSMMGMALAGHVNFLPSTTRRSPGERPIERTNHTIDALMDTLEHMTVGAKLRALLEHSECSYANELRVALMQGYAQMNAEDIAEARGLIR